MRGGQKSENHFGWGAINRRQGKEEDKPPPREKRVR